MPKAPNPELKRVQLIDIDMAASLALADALGIYAYDAYMLDCAQRHRAALLTLDAGLKVAATRADVRVLEVKEAPADRPQEGSAVLAGNICTQRCPDGNAARRLMHVPPAKAR